MDLWLAALHVPVDHHMALEGLLQPCFDVLFDVTEGVVRAPTLHSDRSRICGVSDGSLTTVDFIEVSKEELNDGLIHGGQDIWDRLIQDP